MATLSSKLVLSLVDKVTAPARQISKTVRRLNDAQASNTRQMRAVQSQMLGATGMAFALARGISAPVKSAMEFESAMADVRKVVDFASPHAFQAMGKEIVDLSTQLPITAKGVAEIVAAAGQAGMKGGELMDFAELAAKVGVAFDMTAGQTGESLAKIKTALQLSVGETRDLADALNHLSNTSASSAPDLIDYMKRVGSIGKQYGFSVEQTAALGSAMIASGAEANVAATSFRNVGKALTKGESATKRQLAAFNKLGLSATEVAKNMQEDAVGTLRDVIVRIQSLPEHLRAVTISDLFGDEARAIAPLVSKIELLDGALGSVAKNTEYLGSATKEFETRASTSEASFQKLENQMKAVSIAIGESLIPGIRQVVDTVTPFLEKIRELATAHPKLTRAVIGTAAALVAAQIAAVGARFTAMFLKGGLLSLAGAGLRAAVGIASMLNPLVLVSRAMKLLKWAFMSSGIGLILVGIAAAGQWIYNNWSGLKEMFKSFGGAFMKAIDPIKPALEPVIGLIESLSEVWSAFTGKVNMTDAEWGEIGTAAGQAVGEAVVAVKQKFVDLIDWLAGLPGRIIAAIGNIDLTELISWPSPPAWWKKLFGSGETVKAPGISGTRAAGGHIRQGKTYLVGERGPELVTPGRDGYVHTAARTAGMATSGGGQHGNRTITLNPTFNVYGITEPDALVREFSQKINDAISGVHSDLEWT